MVGFGRNREITILFGLLLTVVDAKTPSSGSTWAGGSLTASAFVGPPKRLVQYGHFNERRSCTVNVDRSDSPKIWCPPRGFVSLRAKPVPDEEMEQRKEQLRDLLCASDEEIDKLLHDNPTVLARFDVVKHYGPKLKLLQERLGINQKEAGRMFLTSQRLLSLSLATLEGKIDWLQERLNLNKTQLRKVIKRALKILTHSIEDHIEPSLKNIQSVLEMSDKELTKMIVKTPDLLFQNFSLDTIVMRRLSFLRDLLNIEEENIAKLRKAVMKHPEILSYQEGRMLAIQKWMKDRFGFGDSKISQVCRIQPHLLVAKIKTLDQRARDIQSELALDNDGLKRMISSTPGLLSTKVEESIRPNVEYLQRTFSLDAEEVKSLLLRYSVLLHLSIEKNMEPKFQFYSELVGKAVAKAAILQNPNLLTVSMKTRLEPRFAEIVKSGDKVQWNKTRLFRMALRTPAQWEAHGLDDVRPRKDSQ